ncbi:hypothetical protein BH09ACT7_BH09ACT7_58530 [soil metagenome]
MGVSALSPAKLMAAILAAGVVSATSVAYLPESHVRPTVSMNVANASAVTDALYGLGDAVGFLNSMVGIHVDATISLPFEATLAALAAAQDPAVAPNVLSYLVQRFVNPAVGDPIHAYPYDTEQAFAVLATLFPYPLGPSASEPGLVNEARRAFADAFNGVLGQLPDPIPGFDAVQGVMNDTVLGGTVVAAQLAVRAPLYMAWNIANYLGYLPANLEATVESAFQAPDQIPGLASNLVYGLLSPDAKVGLFGQLLDNALAPATWLPAPIGQSTGPTGGLANEIHTAITDTTNHILSVLPAPVTPTAAQAPPAELPTGTSTGYGDDAVTTSPKTVEKRSTGTTLTDRDALASNTHATAGSTKATHRKPESIKGRVTRVLTRGDHDKPAEAESSKTAKPASGSAKG